MLRSARASGACDTTLKAASAAQSTKPGRIRGLRKPEQEGKTRALAGFIKGFSTFSRWASDRTNSRLSLQDRSTFRAVSCPASDYLLVRTTSDRLDRSAMTAER